MCVSDPCSYFIRATVGASQKTSGSKGQTERRVTIAIVQSGPISDGTISAAICIGCPAGQSMTCCHVSAVLHAVINLIGTRSSTSFCCRWVAPTTHMRPLAIDAVTPTRHILHRMQPKKRRPQSTSWDPRAPVDANPGSSHARLKRMVERLTTVRRLQGIPVSSVRAHFPSSVLLMVKFRTGGFDRATSRPTPDDAERPKGFKEMLRYEPNESTRVQTVPPSEGAEP